MTDEYTGYKEVVVEDENINHLYSEAPANIFGCIQNQYLIAKDKDGNDLGLWRCDDDVLVKVPFKAINSRFVGKIKPRNTQQQLAIDMLYNNDITVKVLTGRFGTGELFAPLCGNT